MYAKFFLAIISQAATQNEAIFSNSRKMCPKPPVLMGKTCPYSLEGPKTNSYNVVIEDLSICGRVESSHLSPHTMSGNELFRSQKKKCF